MILITETRVSFHLESLGNEPEKALQRIDKARKYQRVRSPVNQSNFERVLLRNPVSLDKDAPPSDYGYTCYSVPGGWRTRDTFRKQFIGPTFNKFSDLLNWQNDNLYLFVSMSYSIRRW